MTNNKKLTGDEVYPRDARLTWNSNSDKWVAHSQPGITRRDWLAALAMNGIMSGPQRDSREVARRAYEVADAMIQED
jgi:hypothetical protein